MSRTLGTSLYAMNVLDAFLTVVLVTMLGAEEANPLTGWLLERSPLLFVFVKVLVVGLCASFLARRGQVVILAVANVAYVLALAAHAACFVR